LQPRTGFKGYNIQLLVCHNPHALSDFLDIARILLVALALLQRKCSFQLLCSELPAVGSCIVHPLVLAIASGSPKVMHLRLSDARLLTPLYLQGRERAACVLAHAAIDVVVKRLIAEAPVCASLVGLCSRCGFLRCASVLSV
jgi:hypothetical protein